VTSYIFGRLGASIPVLFLVSLLIFSVMRILPGDVVLSLLQEAGSFPPEQMARYRQTLGLDQPFLTQYWSWLGNALRGDLGSSLYSGRSVAGEIMRTLPITFELVNVGFLLSLVIAIPLGIVSAVRQGSKADYLSRLIAIGGLSFPDFWLGTLTILGLSLYFGYLPPIAFVPPTENLWANVQQMVFPSLILGFRMSAITNRMIRSSLLEVLRQDYVRTARAKGLREWPVIGRHALKNALIPALTVLGSLFGRFLAGSIVLEGLFLIPGMGRLTFDAVIRRDYPMVQGIVLVMTCSMLLVNLLVDITYSWLDPRIRYR
jgi:peptide/nickel transport system permease protein